MDMAVEVTAGRVRRGEDITTLVAAERVKGSSAVDEVVVDGATSEEAAGVRPRGRGVEGEEVIITRALMMPLRRRTRAGSSSRCLMKIIRRYRNKDSSNSNNSNHRFRRARRRFTTSSNRLSIKRHISNNSRSMAVGRHRNKVARHHSSSRAREDPREGGALVLVDRISRTTTKHWVEGVIGGQQQQCHARQAPQQR